MKSLIEVRANVLGFCDWFTVDDLMYLYRGGRVHAFTAHVGAALGIKPILHVANGGRLMSSIKVRRRKQSIEVLANNIGAFGVEVSTQMIFTLGMHRMLIQRKCLRI
ncbi:MAG: DegV family protein [Candidatus Fimivivens sp.]